MESRSRTGPKIWLGRSTARSRPWARFHEHITLLFSESQSTPKDGQKSWSQRDSIFILLLRCLLQTSQQVQKRHSLRLPLLRREVRQRQQKIPQQTSPRHLP